MKKKAAHSKLNKKLHSFTVARSEIEIAGGIRIESFAMGKVWVIVRVILSSNYQMIFKLTAIIELMNVLFRLSAEYLIDKVY